MFVLSGFLSTGDSNALGNYAMKDLVMSLEWVRDNIAGFGGNPASVTIFGQSAGAGNVHFLMLSPMAKGKNNQLHKLTNALRTVY